MYELCSQIQNGKPCHKEERCGYAHTQDEIGKPRRAAALAATSGIQVGGVPGQLTPQIQPVIDGTKLLVKDETAIVFAATDSWTPVGNVDKGDCVEAAGPPKKVEADGTTYMMVPIKPHGALDMSALTIVREEKAAPAQLAPGQIQLQQGNFCFDMARGFCSKGTACRWSHIFLAAKQAPMGPRPVSHNGVTVPAGVGTAGVTAGSSTEPGQPMPTPAPAAPRKIILWECSKCGEENKAVRKACTSCGTAKPPPPKPIPELPKGPKTSLITAALSKPEVELPGGKGVRRKTPPMAAKGAAESEAKRAKVEAELNAVLAETPTGPWACKCGEENKVTRLDCNNCGKKYCADGADGSTAAAGEARTGGAEGAADAEPPWECSACGETNKGSRDWCNACDRDRAGKVRPKLDGEADATGGEGEAAPAEEAEPEPEGDWECFKCGEPNKPTREKCNACGTDKNGGAEADDEAAGGADQSADWATETMDAIRLTVGTMVRVRGLKAKPQLNGRIVELISFEKSSGRWLVSTADEERFQLKQANLCVTENWQESFKLKSPL